MRFFGPVLLYDMIRMSRRSRFMLLRVLFAALLLITLLLVYASHFSIDSWKDWFETSGEPTQLASFASYFFMWFMIIQWLMIFLLTPAYVAGSIAEEKHRRTLEYILATDLRNREVILGKLISRLANLTLFILAGLPILSLTQLFGGVAPDLLWAGFAVTALTMLSLSGLSIWISVYARRPRDAILLTYLCVITYFAFYGVLAALKYTVFSMPLTAVPSDLQEAAQYGFEWLWYVYVSGNVFQGLAELYLAIGATTATGGYGGMLLELVTRYAVFHGAIFTACTLLAIWRVRRVFVKQTYNTVRAAPLLARKGPSKHVSVGNYPMLWKEIISEGGFGIGWIGAVMTLFIGLMVIGFGVGIVLWISLYELLQRSGSSEELLVLLASLLIAMAIVAGLFLASLWVSGKARWGLRLLCLTLGAAVLYLAAVFLPNRTRLWLSLSQLNANEELVTLLIGLLLAVLMVAGLFLASLWVPGKARWALRLLCLALGAGVLYLAAELFPGDTGVSGRNELGMVMNIYVRIASTVVAALCWLAITVRASGSVGAERDRQTMDSLLSSPLSEIEILIAKWVGSIAAARWLFAVIGMIWLLGLLTGGLSPTGLVLAAACLVVYSAFFCSLGLFCSVHCTTTLRAVLWSVGTAIFFGGAHALCTGSCLMLFLFQTGPGSEWLAMLVMGETPIFVQGAAALRGDEFSNFQSREMTQFAVFAFVGACTFALAAIFLWAATVERFKYSCGRVIGAVRLPPVDLTPARDKPAISAAPGHVAGP